MDEIELKEKEEEKRKAEEKRANIARKNCKYKIFIYSSTFILQILKKMNKRKKEHILHLEN